MKILVTGGGGFLGGALARELVRLGHQVRSFSRSDYPHLKKMGIETIRGNLVDEKAVIEAVKGCDAVFHVAAKAGIYGHYQDYEISNVIGTRNVLTACKTHNVQRLVYTSTPSVVFDGKGHEGHDENIAYPDRFLNAYSKTKAIAEKLVLESNSPYLGVVSLRPHMIWGPGDTQLIPRILKRARLGKLKLVGNGMNLVDSVYIDNAVDAHIQALEKLQPESPIAGKVYFITNDEPLPMKVLMNKVLEAGNLPPVTQSIPAGAAYAAGAVMEFFYYLLNKKEEPLMTRFLARELSQPHWYDITSAKTELDYNPRVSIDEGMRRLKDELSQNRFSEE